MKQGLISEELDLAAKVQRALLPVIPGGECYRISTLFAPQSFVSGDVYYLE